MAEQLVMLPTGKDGALEARGPVWRWWEMDEEHWVGYPDKKVKVVDMDEGWLENVLIYLAKWEHSKVENMFHTWWLFSAYNSDGPTADGASMAFASECEHLQWFTTHREYLELIVPCLKALEEEATKRCLTVPTIPSYKCEVTQKREADDADQEARASKREAKHAKHVAALKRHPKRHRKPTTCSVCGTTGHNARTCREKRP